MNWKNITSTPMVENNLSDKEKMDRIEIYFKKIMEALGLDLSDDSLRDTPKRVAKMYVKEIFSGLDKNNFPKITCVDNKFEYDEMIIECDIDLNSNCEHHFVPIIGKAHVAYIPSEKVIGLSKMNRIVKFFSKRPQIQERLTQQIAEAMRELLNTEDVAVIINAVHTCVKTRGVEDATSYTKTQYLSGKFKDDAKTRAEFMAAIPN